MKNKDIVMQARCVHCNKEQYMMAVYAISMGKEPCMWCDKLSEPMTEEEYYKKLKKKSWTTNQNEKLSDS